MGEPLAADRTAGSTSHRFTLTPARVVMITVLAAIPARLLAQRLADPDLWWHLQTGELIWSTKSIPNADPFSYTLTGGDWVVQEWGAEVLLHGIRSAFGLYGILFYRAIALLILYLIVARLLVRRMGPGMGTSALMALVAFAGAPNWTERPNLISFILFAVTLALLERKDRAIWWFVAIAAVWANFHGMVILGIGLVALVAVSEWLKVATSWDGADRSWARRLSAVAVAGAAASLLNPEGPGLIAHSFRLLRIVQDLVTEWATPDFHELGTLLFLGLLLITIAALALQRGHPPDLTDVMLMLAFTFMALQAARNLALSAIVIGLLCGRALPGAIATLGLAPRGTLPEDSQRSSIVPLAGLVAAFAGLAIVVAAGFPRSGAVEDIVDQELFPVEAIDRLNVPGVRVFAHDTWAAMAIDRIWPNALVYVDLRWDFYGLEHANTYRRAVAAREDWAMILDGSCTTHVLIQPEEPLAEVLKLSPQWQLVAGDALAAGEVGDASEPEVIAVTYARVGPARGCEEYPIPSL